MDLVLNWCLVCQLSLKATMCSIYYYPIIQVKKLRFGKTLQLVLCHATRRWWREIRTQSE